MSTLSKKLSQVVQSHSNAGVSKLAQNLNAASQVVGSEKNAPAAEFVTPKELAPLLRRSARWISAQCTAGKFPTLPPHRRPYLIPKSALFRAAELTAKP
jgi:hypothetical protein